MKKGTIVLLAVVGVLVLLVISGIGMYNRLVSLQVAVDTAWAQVENVLQRRADLIPNLVESVKGYMKHEKAILDNLAQARAAYSGAKTVDEKIKAAGDMGTALSRLLVIVENYPNLKANESVNRLMDELAGTENRIAVERKRYNESVQVFNTTIQRIPYTFFAGTKFIAKPFFKAEEKAKEVPKVAF